MMFSEMNDGTKMIMEMEISHFTENSTTDPQQYFEEIPQARERVYATDL